MVKKRRIKVKKRNIVLKGTKTKNFVKHASEVNVPTLYWFISIVITILSTIIFFYFIGPALSNFGIIIGTFENLIAWTIVVFLFAFGGSTLGVYLIASHQQANGFLIKTIRFYLPVFLIISGFLLMFIGPRLGSIFFPKPPPPKIEHSVGYAKIVCYDPMNNKYVNATIDLLDYDTEVFYNDTLTNTTFYVSKPTLAWVHAKGYYNFSVAVYASGNNNSETPAVSLYSIFKVCPKGYIKFQIIKIDDTYGNFTAKEIPNGTHTIIIESKIIDPYRNKTAWGYGTYYPYTYLPDGSYAKAYNLTQLSAWIAWNGSVSNFTTYAYNYNAYQISNNLNSTYLLNTVFTIQHVITADFHNIKDIYFYFGLVDNWTNYVQKL